MNLNRRLGRRGDTQIGCFPYSPIAIASPLILGLWEANEGAPHAIPLRRRRLSRTMPGPISKGVYSEASLYEGKALVLGWLAKGGRMSRG